LNFGTVTEYLQRGVDRMADRHSWLKTLAARHFGTGAEVSIRHFDTSAEVSGWGRIKASVCPGVVPDAGLLQTYNQLANCFLALFGFMGQ